MNAVEQLLARRYAVALLRVCGERFSSDTLVAIRRAISFFQQHKPALYFLGLPDFPVREKNQIVLKLLEIVELPGCFHDLVKLLGEHKRLRLILPVLSAILSLYQEQHGIIDVRISSPLPLREDQLRSIQQFLVAKTGKTVQYTYHLEKDLIAGIRLQSDTLLWEYSVRKTLRALRLSVMR